MCHLKPIRHGWIVAAALFLMPAPSPAQLPDPVEELRQALPIQISEKLTPVVLDYRKQTLDKRTEALKTLGDLRRALALTEWKDQPGPPEAIRAIDLAARNSVGERFKSGVEAIVKSGSADAKLAAATMLGELGISIRALAPNDPSGFGRSLAPALIELTGDKDAEVRSAAARALGKVNPLPKAAADALQVMLIKDALPQRRAAAEGLLSMIQVVAQMQKKGQAQTGVEALPKDVVAVAAEVVAAATGGLKDADSEVRRAALEAMFQSAESFGTLVPEPLAANLFPPPGRPMTDGEKADIRIKQTAIEGIYQEVAPLARAFRDAGKPLAGALTDAEVPVRLLSRRTLEMVGYARVRVRRFVYSVPQLPTDDGKEPQVHPLLKDDLLGEALRPAVEVIARRISEPNVLVRRAAVDFLETLLDGAIPAISTLVDALADSDRFVRWSAARTLGRIGPVESKQTVPALAKVASSQDPDVAIAAVATLERYGPAARAAVPGLIRVAGGDDQDVRLAAFKALASIADATAVPVLTEALADGDVRVRRGAAQSLGGFGTAARSAAPALRLALGDDDPEVRQNASDALLSILQMGK